MKKPVRKEKSFKCGSLRSKKSEMKKFSKKSKVVKFWNSKELRQLLQRKLNLKNKLLKLKKFILKKLNNKLSQFKFNSLFKTTATLQLELI